LDNKDKLINIRKANKDDDDDNDDIDLKKLKFEDYLPEKNKKIVDINTSGFSNHLLFG
jgi:hypothetical protein